MVIMIGVRLYAVHGIPCLISPSRKITTYAVLDFFQTKGVVPGFWQCKVASYFMRVQENDVTIRSKTSI